MEILDSGEACFVVGDDLLDFTLDGEAEEDYDLKTSYSSSSLTAAFGDDSLSSSFPVSLIHYICLLVLESTRTSRLMTSKLPTFLRLLHLCLFGNWIGDYEFAPRGVWRSGGVVFEKFKINHSHMEKKKRNFLNLTWIMD